MKGDRPRARRGEAMPRPGGPPGRPYERGRLPPLAMPAAPRRDGMNGDSECPEARASPGRLSPSSRDRPALHPGPKGGAEGAPDERGVLEGGACPHLHVHVSDPCLAAPRRMKMSRSGGAEVARRRLMPEARTSVWAGGR